MSTLEEKDKSTEGQPQQQQQQQQQQQPPTPKIPFSEFTSKLNSDYQEKIRKYAQKPDYKIHIATAPSNGKARQSDLVTFTRMKLLQYQFDEIEEIRAEATELSMAGKLQKADILTRQMYKKAASYLLWNVSADRPMTEDEYKMSDFAEVRPALDSAMLISLVSDPN
jgi:hypothetical protein